MIKRPRNSYFLILCLLPPLSRKPFRTSKSLLGTCSEQQVLAWVLPHGSHLSFRSRNLGRSQITPVSSSNPQARPESTVSPILARYLLNLQYPVIAPTILLECFLFVLFAHSEHTQFPILSSHSCWSQLHKPIRLLVACYALMPGYQHQHCLPN